MSADLDGRIRRVLGPMAGEPLPPTKDEEIAQLRHDLAAARADAESWKQHLELYKSAWLRALGNKIFNKRHLIDALVKTTAEINEKANKYDQMMVDVGGGGETI